MHISGTEVTIDTHWTRTSGATIAIVSLPGTIKAELSDSFRVCRTSQDVRMFLSIAAGAVTISGIARREGILRHGFGQELG
jgi:hypothetical protein